MFFVYQHRSFPPDLTSSELSTLAPTTNSFTTTRATPTTIQATSTSTAPHENSSSDAVTTTITGKDVPAKLNLGCVINTLSTLCQVAIMLHIYYSRLLLHHCMFISEPPANLNNVIEGVVIVIMLILLISAILAAVIIFKKMIGKKVSIIEVLLFN